MPLILSLKEVKENKKKKKNFQTYKYSFQTKIIPKIQILHFFFIQLISLRLYKVFLTKHLVEDNA